MTLPNLQDLTQIVAPIYMTNHWDLVYTDLQQQNIYFDDGMEIEPPKLLLPFIKQALDLLSEIYPTIEPLKSHFWHSNKAFV